MPFIIQYILKLSIALSAVYLFYVLFLRRLTFYNWNRWYLLGYSFLSFIISFINIAPLLERNAWGQKQVVQIIPAVGNYLPQKEGSATSYHWFTWNNLLFLLLAGAVIISLRLFIQFISYHRLRRSARLLLGNRLKVYHVNKKIIPFSFGNAIFINQHQHGEEELKEIIRHEFVHVKQKHTIDILFAECLCIFNWYNPFAWLIRHSIRQNLEFIADHKVLANGVDKKQYQYLLLKVIGVSQFSITSSFNFSSLKKRIVMMNKIKSARVQAIRFLFLLPLGIGLLLSFRSSRHTPIVRHAVAYYSNVWDTVPERTVKDSDVDMINVRDHIAIVKLKNGVEERYNLKNAAEKSQFEKKYGSIAEPAPPAPPVEPAPPPEPPRPAEFAPPAKPAAPPSAPRPPSKKEKTWQEPAEPEPVRIKPGTPAALVLIDGKVGTVKDVSPDAIEKIEVYKDSMAIAKYGEKGIHGVVLITTIKTKTTPVVNVQITPAKVKTTTTLINVQPVKKDSL